MSTRRFFLILHPGQLKAMAEERDQVHLTGNLSDLSFYVGIRRHSSLHHTRQQDGGGGGGAERENQSSC